MIVGIRHWKKDKDEPQHKGGGSVGIGANARVILAIAKHPEDPTQRVVVRVKGNLAREEKTPTLGYRIIGVFVEGQEDLGEQPKLEWLDKPVAVTVADLFPRDSRKSSPERDRAERFLRELLGGGRIEAKEVYLRAEEEGISERTLERAKRRLGVASYQEHDQGAISRWWWELPPEEVWDFDGHGE